MLTRPARLLVAALVLAALGCGGYGRKVSAGDTEVYYKDGATEADARRLLEFLSTRAPAAPGQRRSYQLMRTPDGVVVRLTVKAEQADDEALLAVLAEDARRLSEDLFDHQPVVMELCDEHLRPRKSVPWGSEGLGRKVTRDRFEVFYQAGATEAEARKLLEKLARELPARGDRGTVQLLRRGDTYVVRCAQKPEMIEDANAAAGFRQAAREWSAELFDGKPVDVELCDAMLRTQKTIPWGQR